MNEPVKAIRLMRRVNIYLKWYRGSKIVFFFMALPTLSNRVGYGSHLISCTKYNLIDDYKASQSFFYRAFIGGNYFLFGRATRLHHFYCYYKKTLPANACTSAGNRLPF